MSASAHVSNTLAAVTTMLHNNGYQFEVVSSGNGALLLLPKFGRVLGLWSDTQADCHFWINPQLLMSSATDFCKDDARWANPGGHRIWLAPEREFFIHDLSHPFETYQVPSAIDPGNYKCTYDSLSVQLYNSGRLRAFVSQTDCDFKIMRTISLLPGSEIFKLTKKTQIQAVGYRESIDLAVDNGCPAGIWSLIQVPLRGTISMPVSRSGSHKIFFGNEGNIVNYGNGLLNLNLTPDPRQEFKIGFKVSDCGDIITCLHIYPDESATLIVNKFGPGTESVYVDTPWNQPEDTGYAVQFFCGGIHGFGELETHGSVYKSIEGYCESKLTIFVYAFSGQRELITQIQNNILNCSKHELTHRA